MGLGNVSPRLAVNHLLDSVVMYIEHIRHFLHGVSTLCVPLSNVAHGILSEFRRCMAYASSSAALAVSVHHVVPVSAQEQVEGANATRVVTFMQNCYTREYPTKGGFKAITVGASTPLAIIKDAIAVWVAPACEYPTAIGFDYVSPEPRFNLCLALGRVLGYPVHVTDLLRVSSQPPAVHAARGLSVSIIPQIGIMWDLRKPENWPSMWGLPLYTGR